MDRVVKMSGNKNKARPLNIAVKIEKFLGVLLFYLWKLKTLDTENTKQKLL